MRENSRKAWVESDPGWWMSAHNSLVELKVVFKPPSRQGLHKPPEMKHQKASPIQGPPLAGRARLSLTSLIHQMIYFYYFKLCVFTVLYFISRERELRRWRQPRTTRRSNTLTHRGAQPAPFKSHESFFFVSFFLFSSLPSKSTTKQANSVFFFYFSRERIAKTNEMVSRWRENATRSPSEHKHAQNCHTRHGHRPVFWELRFGVEGWWLLGGIDCQCFGMNWLKFF